VPYVINPETVWSCTTCRACEEQCPVGIGYVDKIVNLRRDLVLMRGEVPASLQRSFDGLERHGNPWQLPREQRTDWTKELQIPRLADLPRTQVLYWVGCAASYDERAQRVARALVSLLRMAGVDFAILGKEETCTGDAARRAGNEYLFLQLAHANVETLNKYYGEGRFERIVTACPHCLTTLKHEYPDFGGKWPVFHHSQFLLELVQQGKLTPKDVSNTSVVLHDPCTLSRYTNDLVSTRQLLKKVPNTALVEPEHNRNFTLCCGAGGSHMWMEDHGPLRMNEARTRELLATGAEKVVTACPFCSSMLGDGLARMRGGNHSELLDIAELLVESCGGGQT
jgi:Fe-S oxidoreductase